MYKVFKRFFDFSFASICLFLALPILLICCIILLIVQKSNPIFSQSRPGKDEKIFKIYKLKTMLDTKDQNGVLLSDMERLTFVGKIIRKLSFDELPQLLNVIKGEMSFIGPRPLLVQYLDLYSQSQKRRHEIKPGITGWAQVNGRNAISWQEKFEYDVWYVQNLSFLLDVKIIIMTIKNLIFPIGINQNPNITMEYFNGKN